MSAASSALVKALFGVLSQDTALIGLLGSGKVFDKVPERVDVPYVVLGRATVSDWSTSTEDGETIVFFLHVWTREGARMDNDAIQQRLRDLLTGPLPPLPDVLLINLRFQLAEVRRDRANDHVHAVMRFRAVLEPVG